MAKRFLLVLTAAFWLQNASAFIPSSSLSSTISQPSPSAVALMADKKSGGIDPGTRKRILSESIAPWRTLRLFIYGAGASGAALGGFITLTGLLAAMSQGRTDFDVNTEYLNLAIDFGAVAVFGALGKFDLDKQAELNEKVSQKLERKKQEKVTTKAMRQREKTLANLLLQVQVSLDGETRESPVRDLQLGAKQHMILVAGPKKACRDALIGANLLKMDFAMSNILVVPYETDGVRTEAGFGDRPLYETQPYIARPSGEGWDEYIQAELKDAIEQSGENAKEEGIAIVVASNGNVIRRGVGKVPWRLMVEELENEINPKAESNSFWP